MSLKYRRSLVAKQRGFLIPVAMLLVVGIGVLALTISRITSQSSISAYNEGISLQAFYAAESGAYFGMNQLLFNVTLRTAADTNCINLDGSTLNGLANGLQACSVSITCSADTVGGDPQSFYTIVSTASCGAGEIYAERSVEVKSYY
ncbi:MAG: pilus assembly PilX N-terminal domain-containing protein [Agarilytica sp.]